MNNYTIKLLIIALTGIIVSPSILYGNSDIYYDNKREGWFWHKLQPLKEKKGKKEEKKNTRKPEPSRQQMAVEKVEGIKQKTQELLSTAIIDPTQKNVTEFMYHQKALLEMSDKFRKAWEIALLTTPELDYTIDHPVSQVALQTAGREEYLRQTEQINEIGKEAGIYFIFSSTCPYCIKQSKILSRFENNYDMAVFPLTINNEGLPEYPDPAIGTWMMDTLSITRTPTLILAYPQEGKMLPLASGLITEKELIRRILMLNQRKGDI